MLHSISLDDTKSLSKASIGKPSLGQSSVGQANNMGVDSSSNKYKLSICQVIEKHVISSSRLKLTFGL